MVRKNIPQKRASTPRPYNWGTMSESELRSYIMSWLRDKSRWWRPKNKAIARARISKWLYKCENCWEVGKWKLPPLPWNKRQRNNADADHIKSVIPVEGFKKGSNTFLWYDWTEVIKRLFVEEEWYKTLCWKCHKIKTTKDNAERKLRKNATL